MKPRSKNESKLGVKFEQILTDTSLTPKKMKEARRAFKHAMKKQSRRIDSEVISQEMEGGE